MLIHKNLTYKDLFLFINWLGYKYDLNYRELKEFEQFKNLDKIDDILGPYFEGWVFGIACKYHESVKDFLRREKLKQLK